MPTLRLAVALAATALIAVSAGCSGKPAAEVSPDAERRGRLKEVSELLALHGEQKKKPPARIGDLRPFENASPGGYASLRTGDIVPVWGALPDAGSTAVLAHEKKTPTEGGLVLLANGDVKEMTADEFKTAPKAATK